MAPTTKKPAKSMQKPIEKPISKSKKTKKKSYTSFSIYIYKLLKSVTDAKVGISKKSMLIMNNFILDWLQRLAMEASRMLVHGKKNTLGSREVQSAVRLLLPGELAKHANIEGIKALNMYRTNQKLDPKKKT